MQQDEPGDRLPKDILEEFEALGGTPRLLERLIHHPALKIIEQLDEKKKGEKAELLDRLAEFNSTIDQTGDSLGSIAARFVADNAFHKKTQRWLKDFRRVAQILSRIKLGLEVERFRHSQPQRRGLAVTHFERYFYCAFLIPYTAFLRRRRGKSSGLKWEWIEWWLKETEKLRLDAEIHLRPWWLKEVVKRKSWPSRAILYALAAGAAMFLETRKKGKRVHWVTEWSRANMPRRTEYHPALLKRRLNAEDHAYLRCVFDHVPIVRKEFERIYPDFRSTPRAKYADPMEAILQKKTDKALEKLPARARILVAKLQGKFLNTKIFLRKERAALIARTSPGRRKKSFAKSNGNR